VFADFDDPVPQVDEELIVVIASALSHVTKSRASGSHHTSPGSLPAVVGIDGVGRTQDGRRVYFVLPEEPFGGMAERAAVRADQCIPLPADVDDITAAAIAIPGMSSWAALKERAHESPCDLFGSHSGNVPVDEQSLARVRVSDGHVNTPVDPLR
jgi:NADPH:quinone reductase-like Zn-dependent oxidoreductase